MVEASCALRSTQCRKAVVSTLRELNSILAKRLQRTAQKHFTELDHEECFGPVVAIAYNGLENVADHRWPATSRRRAYVNKRNEVAH
jgi:hypothetical protein